MPLVIADRVLESSNTTGTGTLTLAGAVTGFRTFSSAVGNSNTTYYTITLDSAGEWEVGLGTVGAGTLTRTTVLASSNANALVNFSAGTKLVFATYPAGKSVYQQSDGSVGIGIASPTYRFMVSDGTATMTFAPVSSVGYVGTFSNHPVSFRVNDTERMRITTNGGVSFGATGTAYGTTGQLLLSNGDAPPSWSNTVSGLNLLGTTTVPAAKFDATSVRLTTATAGAFEYDLDALYFTPFGTSRGTVPAEQYVVLNTAYTLTSQTAAQRLFNVGTNGAVAIETGTYAFECVYALSGMSTGNSASFGFALGGTATFTQRWTSLAQKSAALATAATGQITFNTAANTALTGNSTTATGQAVIRGTINCTAAGTVIPQVSLGAAAAASVNVGSYFRIYPISPTNSTTNVTVGNWT